MPARLFPYAFLPIICAVCISASAGQDLPYYRDLRGGPSSEDFEIQHLAKLLKTFKQNAAYGDIFFPGHHLEEIGAQKQRRKLERAKEIPPIHQIFPLFSEKSALVQGRIERRLSENEILNALNPRSRIHLPTGYNRPFIETPKPYLRNLIYPAATAEWHPDRKTVASEIGMKEGPVADLEHRFMPIERMYPPQYPSRSSEHSDIGEEETHPGFTFKKAKSNPREKADVPFSVPGEPEFDQDREYSTHFTEAGSDIRNEQITEQLSPVNDADVNTNFNDQKELTKPMKSDESSPRPQPIPIKNYGNDDDDENDDDFITLVDSVAIRPMSHRRAENHSPMIQSVDHNTGNDIYFVAIIAGCSAAAMFVLVLISLTWCRFQRGAKAAADVEYPAYGVTGPNKDTSPSGDRRLAQSAQMYHYQHQKQQIIAMESRTATGRDPGSVSEAESDEENEEGDYTVYECPGLAPTGEMEVKNPLFHDDPTPATPAEPGQSNRSSEDQNI